MLAEVVLTEVIDVVDFCLSRVGYTCVLPLHYQCVASVLPVRIALPKLHPNSLLV